MLYDSINRAFDFLMVVVRTHFKFIRTKIPVLHKGITNDSFVILDGGNFKLSLLLCKCSKEQNAE